MHLKHVRLVLPESKLKNTRDFPQGQVQPHGPNHASHTSPILQSTNITSIHPTPSTILFTHTPTHNILIFRCLSIQSNRNAAISGVNCPARHHIEDMR